MMKPDFMEKLLDGAKVEWKSLGEVGLVRMCKRILKEQTLDTGDIPFYKIGTFGKEANAYISRKLFDEYRSKYSYPKIGEVLLSASGTIGRTVIFDGQDAYFQDSNIVWIENDETQVLNKYLFYFYMIAKWQISEGGTIQRLYNDNLKKTKIPIPPLKVQAEIVRILDTFTELTAELTADLTTELTARRKQYNYYRDQLLTFEEDEVEWKMLEEVTVPTTNIKWGDTNDSYRYIDLTSVCRVNNIITETTEISAKNAPSRAKKLIREDDVIFATTRPTQQRLCLITEEFSGEVASTGYCILRANKNEVLPKWIYYFITSSKFMSYVEENQSGSAYPAISDAKVKNFEIPVPSLTEQNRLVYILDKFEVITNSITEGLSLEIELRQKQYEYYRNMLLSFPKEEV